MNAGAWESVHVGVRAPGMVNITTFFPLKTDSSEMPFGPESPITMASLSSGMRVPVASVIVVRIHLEVEARTEENGSERTAVPRPAPMKAMVMCEMLRDKLSTANLAQGNGATRDIKQSFEEIAPNVKNAIGCRGGVFAANASESRTLAQVMGAHVSFAM